VSKQEVMVLYRGGGVDEALALFSVSSQGYSFQYELDMGLSGTHNRSGREAAEKNHLGPAVTVLTNPPV
jgi:hypothetical protein